MKKKNVTIIFISHRMEEQFTITDRVTIMRDGRYVSTVDIKSTTDAIEKGMGLIPEDRKWQGCFLNMTI